MTHLLLLSHLRLLHKVNCTSGVHSHVMSLLLVEVHLGLELRLLHHSRLVLRNPTEASHVKVSQAVALTLTLRQHHTGLHLKITSEACTAKSRVASKARTAKIRVRTHVDSRSVHAWTPKTFKSVPLACVKEGCRLLCTFLFLLSFFFQFPSLFILKRVEIKKACAKPIALFLGRLLLLLGLLLMIDLLGLLIRTNSKVAKKIGVLLLGLLGLHNSQTKWIRLS